jgi:putative ABC transport system permease protein
MFNKEFVVLVSIAFVIAAPLAYYFMNQWLQDFTYRIYLSWWMFGLGALLTIVITLVTISHQSIRAAMANPVDSLRNE